MADPPASSSSSSAPASSGGFGGALKSKFGPLPVWAWLAIITILALGYYLLSSRKKSTAQQQTMAGQPGVVVVNQDQDGGGGKKHKKGKHHPPKEPGNSRDIQVSKDETLGQLAASRHWSKNTLGEVEEMNVTQGQGEWTPDTKLTKGEEVLRPWG